MREKYQNILAQIYRKGVDLILPPLCPLCRTPLQDADRLCIACWQQIDFINEPFCRKTGHPMPQDYGEDTILPMALINPPAYHRARAAYTYNDTGAHLIRLMKFSDSPELATLLARFLAPAGAEFLPQADFLLPVPIHPRRLLYRRFNQSAELCRALAPMVEVPIAYDWLIRTRHTPQQLGLTRAQRQRNLTGAFRVRDNKRALLKGKKIVLVDDVLTTGSTVEICAKTLYRAGVAQVDVLTVAMVVKPEMT